MWVYPSFLLKFVYCYTSDMIIKKNFGLKQYDFLFAQMTDEWPSDIRRLSDVTVESFSRSRRRNTTGEPILRAVMT